MIRLRTQAEINSGEGLPVFQHDSAYSRRLILRDNSLIPQDMGLILGDNSLIPQDMGLILGDNSLIPRDSGLILGDSGLIPRDSGLIPEDSGLILGIAVLSRRIAGLSRRIAVLSFGIAALSWGIAELSWGMPGVIAAGIIISEGRRSKQARSVYEQLYSPEGGGFYRLE